VRREGSRADATEEAVFTYSDDFGHFARLNRSVSVDVVHLERPLQLLFRFSGGGDVNGQQKLLEVDSTAVVGVECPEHMLAELLGVALRKEARVHLEEFGPSQLTGRTILLRSIHDDIECR